MKKAKLILAGLALFAVVGTSLAFKANRGNHVLYIGTTSTQCTLEVISATTSTVGLRYFTSDEPTTFCPVSTLTTTIPD